MRLLFITQKIDENDDDLAFAILWVKEFIKQGFEVEVICLEKGIFDNSFPVHSLGKESGVSRIERVFRFLKYIVTLKYDAVFVHMNPEYVTLGGWLWFLRRNSVYLWYTHYTMHFHLWVAGIFSRYMFAATKQSLPQYNDSSKKIVLGHGIDINYWTSGVAGDQAPSNHDIVMVHRLSSSKRVEIGIKSLKFLPKEYTLSIYGRGIDGEYLGELKSLIDSEELGSRVVFKGPVPMFELKKVYPKHRLMINMASETIDKTMLEAMVFGIYPVTTQANARAIGLSIYPREESPEAIAEFILSQQWQGYTYDDLASLVKKKHGLPLLIQKIKTYVQEKK
jgi:glycosyltransferase involved in cell wall biosynthesis